MSASEIRTSIKFHIRPMEDADIPKVVEIDRQSFSLPWPQSSYHYELHENPSSALWVAVDSEVGMDEKVVGMVVVWFIIDEAHIATIAVDPAYRRREIARHLLLSALQGIVSKGFEIATLEVRASNTAAKNLYRRFGFEIEGVRLRYYRDNNEDALIMTLRGLNPIFLNRLAEDFSKSGSGDQP